MTEGIMIASTTLVFAKTTIVFTLNWSYAFLLLARMVRQIC